MGWPTDYAGWQNRIREWLTAYDLPISYIGYCLDSANQRLNRDLSSQWMEATFPHTVDTNPIVLPTLIPDYNRMRLVNIVNGPSLKASALNEFTNMVAANPYGGGDPTHYCINAMELLIWPPVAAGNTVLINYYMDIPALSDTIPSNVFTTKHPDAFLYASLLEATPMIGEDERLETWATFYTGIQQSINVAADRANMGSTPLQREIKVM